MPDFMVMVVQSMVSEYLRYGDLNVVVLDWLAGSGPPYTQAVANIRLIGAMLGFFLLGLQVNSFRCNYNSKVTKNSLCRIN